MTRSRARDLAQQLHDRNGERQQVEAEIRETCQGIAVDESAAALVYYSESWHRGVLGIVASRMVERFHRPVFVLGLNADDGLVQGSGRSIPAFHLLDALESMRDLFVRFGGHEHAAGVTIEASRVEEFRERFNRYAAANLAPEDFQPRMQVDAARRPARDLRYEASIRSSRSRRSAMAIRRRCSRRSMRRSPGRRRCGRKST